MSDARTLGVYAAQADEYVKMMDEEARRDQMMARFVAACPPGGRVLDLGCGPGHYARRMAQAGLVVDAIDAVPEMVAYAAAHPSVTATVGRFDDLTAVGLYDGIWAFFSLLHAPRADMDTHLAAIARALKPGGAFFIGLKRGTGGKRDGIDRYYEYYELPELEERLARAGLTPVDHWYGKGTGLAAQKGATPHPEGWIVIHAHG